MKKILFSLFTLSTFVAFSQSQLGINYQSIIRNTNGTIMASTPVTVEFKLYPTLTFTNTLLYHETHSTTTNQFGMANLVIGQGTIVGGIVTFSNIPWPAGVAYEIYVNSNLVGLRMPFVSVPYAFAAAYAPAPSVTYSNNILSVGGNTATILSGTTYTAGSGINVIGNTISNTAPDQTVTITPAGSASVSGTYPNFTINTPTTQVYTAGNGIDITAAGVISNTAIPVTPTITSTGIAMVTPTTGNNFTISVGQPTLSYSNATNVLSLTHDGATITTATLSGTGSNTVSIVGAGLATVTPTTGSTFTVSVPTPVYNQATGVLGFGTNTVIATPTLTLSGTTLTSGASTNSVNLASLPGLWTAPTATTVVTTNSLSLVGIGNNTPTHKLDVTANTTTLAAIHGYNIGSGISSTGVFGEHSSSGIGVYGQSISGQGIWGKSTSNAGVYGESVSGDAGKFLMTGTGSSYGIQVQTNGSGAALYAKSFNASALAARFDGNAVITHTSTSASPHINLVSPTITDFGRVKFSNTGSTGYFSIEGRNNTGGAADAFNIAHNNGANERQVFLINGNRQVFVNNLNFPLATFHVMTSVATATGGIASEGFLQAGQINLIRNNQTATTRLQVNLGDEIGKINFAGYDGSGFGDGAKIYAKATETVTTSNKGTELIFAAVPTGTNTNKDAFKINGLGQLEVISSIRIPGSPAVTAGQVLTAIDALGNASWQTPSAPVGPWIQSAGTVTLGVATSSVGIGTNTPNSPFQVLNYVSFENNGSNTSLGFNTGTGVSPNNYYNTMIGASAGQAIGTGSSFANTFMGYHSGLNNSNGNSNTFVGSEAGSANTASNNTYFGANAGRLSTTGNANVFLGANSGAVNTIGTSNVFLGFDAGKSNTLGNDNTFVGRNSGPANTTGSSNIYIGSSTGNLSSTGSFNVFLGNSAGNNTTNGNSNVFIGYQTGVNNTTGQSNTFIGRGADLFSTTQYTNATAIGFNSRVNANDALVLGNSATKVGIGTTAPLAILDVVSTTNTIAISASSSGTVESMSIKNTNANVNAYAGVFDGGLVSKGKTTTSTGFSIKAFDNASNELFGVRNDGHVGVNATSPAHRLTVVEPNATNAAIFGSNVSGAANASAHGIMGLTSNSHTLAAAVFGQNSNSGPSIYGVKSASETGIAGRFELLNNGNSADAIFAKTDGSGSALHAVASTTANMVSTVALWVENGHIKATGANPTITSTVTSLQSYTVIGTDVAGKLSVLTSTLTGVPAAQDILQVTFSKPYSAGSVPTIILTNTSPNSFAVQAYVTGVTNNGFKVRFNTAPNLNTNYSFNYIVIE